MLMVTVYITTKNRSLSVIDALDSVLNQSYKNIEIIVVNDGSTDNTKDVLLNYKQKHSERNIKIINNVYSVGACAARNQAITLAESDYITGLDDDDLFECDRILKFVANIDFLEIHSFLYTNLSLGNKKIVKHRVANLDDIVYSNVVGSQVFTKKERFLALGGFNEQLLAWQDHDMWIRLVERFGVGKNISNCSYIVKPSRDSISLNPERIKQAYLLFSNRGGHLSRYPLKAISYINMHQYTMFSYPRLSTTILFGGRKVLLRYFTVLISRVKRDLVCGKRY